MMELTLIGAAMKVAFWVLQFWVSAPEPVVPGTDPNPI